MINLGSRGSNAREVRRLAKHKYGYKEDPLEGKRLDISEFDDEGEYSPDQIYSNPEFEDYEFTKENRTEKITNFLELGNMAALSENKVISKTIAVNYVLQNKSMVQKFKDSLETSPVEVFMSNENTRTLLEYKFGEYINRMFKKEETEEEWDDVMLFNSCWIHLKLGMAIFLEKLLKDDLLSKCPIFDPLWDLSLLNKKVYYSP